MTGITSPMYLTGLPSTGMGRYVDIKPYLPIGSTAFHIGVKEKRYPRKIYVSRGTVCYQFQDLHACFDAIARTSSLISLMGDFVVDNQLTAEEIEDQLMVRINDLASKICDTYKSVLLRDAVNWIRLCKSYELFTNSQESRKAVA